MGNTGAKQDSDKDHHDEGSSSPVVAPPDDTNGSNLDVSCLGKKKNGCGVKQCMKKTFLTIFFVAMGALTIITAISEILATVTTAVATKIYSTEMSGRNVAMILLAVTAAIVLSIAIYSIVAVLRGKKKVLYAIMISLVILAVLQAVICGMVVAVTTEDEVELSRSLSDSFRLARDNNPRYIKIWDATQHELSCCGVHSAEDYRQPAVPYYFPPDVPVACCPGYDPNRSDLLQERAREICKARKEFYNVGCKNLVMEVLKDSSTTVLCVTVVLIILEITVAVASYLLSRSKGKHEGKDELSQGTLGQAETGRRSADKKTKPQNQKDTSINLKDTPQNYKASLQSHKSSQKDKNALRDSEKTLNLKI